MERTGLCEKLRSITTANSSSFPSLGSSFTFQQVFGQFHDSKREMKWFCENQLTSRNVSHNGNSFDDKEVTFLLRTHSPPPGLLEPTRALMSSLFRYFRFYSNGGNPGGSDTCTHNQLTPLARATAICNGWVQSPA